MPPKGAGPAAAAVDTQAQEVLQNDSAAETPRVKRLAMPRAPPGFGEHRERLAVDLDRTLLAMVARSVTRQETSSQREASRPLKVEAATLAQRGAWDPSGVREWRQVADEVRNAGKQYMPGAYSASWWSNTQKSPTATWAGSTTEDVSSRGAR